MLAFAPLDGAVGAAYTAVSTLATALTPLAGTHAAAAAIVGFTIAIRLLLTPLSYAQIRGERRRAALAPRLHKLQQRYADNPARLREETYALCRAEGATPFTGCLPALLQAPFFLVMYRLYTTASAPTGGPGALPHGHAGDGLLGQRLFGVPLDQQLTDGLAGPATPLFAVLLALLALLAWRSSRRIRRASAPPTGAGGEPAGAASLARIMPLLPYGTVLVAAIIPLAAVLHLLTTTAWTALEQTVVHLAGR